MDKKLSSVDVFFMVKELQLLIDSKIDKIYDDVSGGILLSFHKQEQGKIFVKIIDELVYVSSSKSNSIDSPSEFCTRLRKHLTDTRVRKITQIESERIISFELSTKDSVYFLIIELFGGGNIILLKDEIIITAKILKEYTKRSILPNKKYEYPKQNHNFFKLSKEEISEIITYSQKENIVKSLATDFSFGGIYAEEILHISKLDKSLKPKDANIYVSKIHLAIEELFLKETNPNKTNLGIFPIELQTQCENRIYYDTLSKAIEENSDTFDISPQKKQAFDKYEQKIKKLNLIIEIQKKQLNKMEEEAKKQKEKGDLIYKNYMDIELQIKNSKTHKLVVDLL
jgi:predicted ribosome quality control (RQC) complex YloA/Tae2 family protein